MTHIRFSAGILAVALAAVSFAQHHTNKANWAQMEKYSNSALSRFVYSSRVNPSWINKSDRFWYVWNDSDGKRFMFVDSAGRKRERAFDHDKLAGALSELGKKPVVGNQLPFNSIDYNEKETAITFTVERVKYEWDLKAETLKVVPEKEDEGEATPPRGPRGGQGGQQGGQNNRPRSTASTAPDKLAIVYQKGYNLYFGVKEKEETEIDDVEMTQLTKDGEQFYEFAGVNYRTYTLGDKDERAHAIGVDWSKDSEMFAITRVDGRKLADLFVINSLANPRPTLEIYKYQMPGEENVEQRELLIFDRNTKELKKVPADKWKDQMYFNIHWVGKGHDKLRFVRRDRLQRNLEFCEYDTNTNEVKVLLSEAVENAFIELRSARYLGDDNTGDFIWWSERSGWGHFYLYGHDGKLKNAITSGPWRAEDLVDVDAKGGKVWFSAVGKEPGENLYNEHQYSVGIDGKGMRMLTSGDANHSLSLSDSHKFGVNNYSRIDMVPTAVLRDDQGRVVMELEKMDLSKMEEIGWQMPERFVVKSSDGVTDIFGNMWKPFDFSPNKKYPIILYVYPGPQTESVSNGFTPVSTLQEIAQLGFIVIQIGNRGGTPQRSNAYHSYGYYNLRDYGLADKKAGVEQLAGRYSWIDIDKVGIFGHSGGGFMTAAALLLPPYNDFFKVGVSSAGNHDNNIYNSNWSEQHHGLRVVEEQQNQGNRGGGAGRGGRTPEEMDAEAFYYFDYMVQQQNQNEEQKEQEKDNTKFEIKVPTTVELAPNLKGKLLVAHGDMDNNVHPGNSVRLVDALIKANKRFDFMLLPGQRHGFGSMNNYFQQRLREYFATHLLGDNYESSSDMNNKSGFSLP